MTNYHRLYRFAVRPWERYRQIAEPSISAVLDREELPRTRPLGRALDLGCGRGLYTRELAKRGWHAVGIDYVPAAIQAARRGISHGAAYVVGDVTQLSEEMPGGRFDFFLDIGCFQGLTTEAAGLGWPLNTTLPRWYRLGLRA
ncbi:class I SAM-dependent methyltransferase [Ornithinimicrobium cavernae]|uniref:class I SAM-dependent methyltransferase n=1 Tax=Ornithinimicrobium cavernae TaxID=2666047 RepID=UPI000D68DE42|nr:class I SAM-dependent methyltransferase [Ornithinimicrobium cavernae]